MSRELERLEAQKFREKIEQNYEELLQGEKMYRTWTSISGCDISLRFQRWKVYKNIGLDYLYAD